MHRAPASRDARGGAFVAALWLLAAVLGMLSVLIVNGRPLFYFDTVGYVEQGRTALMQLGLIARPVVAPLAGGAAEMAAATVDGSRSAVYALLAGGLAQLRLLEGLVVLNLVAVLVALWLPMRVAVRRWSGLPPLARLVAVPLIAAALGSLPFFIAYLMPDTFAPVLLLVIATLTVFGRDMKPWEIVLALALGALAVMSHLSHLAIAGLMLPAAALMALILGRRRWWLPPLLVAAIVGIGFAEQKALRAAARSVSHAEVVIKPYITARLIQDGPGLRYLETHCPDPVVATCALYDALQQSDDPYRLTASHIVFEQSARLGSFRHLDAAAQKRVADSQIGFFLDVLRDAPLATAMAFVKNAFIQAGWVSVEMTLPSPAMIVQHEGVTGLAGGAFANGWITENTGWLSVVTPFQYAVYLVSFALAGALCLLPGRVPGQIRALAVMLGLGILANALVCGGISQPATRYGARVIWLLPMAAAMLVLFSRRDGWFDRARRDA